MSHTDDNRADCDNYNVAVGARLFENKLKAGR